MQSLKAKAYSLLAKQAYFSKQLRKKLLEKEYPPEEVDALIEELSKRGWLNDEELATRFVQRQREKGYGARMIAKKLFDKAGPIDVPIDDSKEAALALIEKKYSSKEEHKVVAALMRRGYSYDLIKSLLHTIRKTR